MQSRYDTVNFSHKFTHGGHPVVFLRGQDTGCIFREFKVYCILGFDGIALLCTQHHLTGPCYGGIRRFIVIHSYWYPYIKAC